MGRVLSVNTKARIPGERGIPKQPVGKACIHFSGVEGDYNNYRTESKASTPKRAVLLYTSDLLQQLNQEGWPVAIGDLGENLTIDIPYELLKVGTRVRIGDVLLEVTEAAGPCKVLGNLPYVTPEELDDFIRTMKGRRGMYCRVLREGSVESGQPVEIIE